MHSHDGFDSPGSKSVAQGCARIAVQRKPHNRHKSANSAARQPAAVELRKKLFRGGTA
jgi:hypothetical protein